MKERSEQENVRIAKLNALKNRGFLYPNDVKVTASCQMLKSLPDESQSSAVHHTIAGRLVQIRHMGKALFAHVLDQSGKIQVYIRQDAVGNDSFQDVKEFDLGDIIEASGYVFTTKTGEKSLHVESCRLLSKALIPLPEKWHGLTDIEARYRYRYVDLIANPEIRETFRTRAKIIAFVRSFFNQKKFLEVETPVLHYVPGGATARPFKTFHNALSHDMYLRIALELPLKKLVVGGFERVYEIGRNFRNEGLSKKHNPEFTMLEFYQAFSNFEDLMDLTEEFFLGLCKEITGGTRIKYGEHEIDFASPWPRISMLNSIYEIGGVSRDIDLNSVQSIQKLSVSKGIDLIDSQDWGRSLDDLWQALVEPKLISPVFITHHPFSISPLARRNDKDPRITDRFELIIAGMELANAFSELNDPLDQRQRFEEQADRKAKGDEEACDVDEDFLHALEYGLPPTAGEGIGIDRLVMLFTNSQSIRDVLLFPQLKPLEDTIG